MDRDLYKISMQKTLKNYQNLDLIEAGVQDLLLEESLNLNNKPKIRGVSIEKDNSKCELTGKYIILVVIVNYF